MRRIFLPCILTIITTCGPLCAAAVPGPEREEEYYELKVRAEECTALLSIAANDLRACEAGGAAMALENNKRSSEVNALRMKIKAMEAMLADPGNSVERQNPAGEDKQDLQSSQDERIARLKKELQAAEYASGLSGPMAKELAEQRKALAAKDQEIAGLNKDLAATQEKAAEIASQTLLIAKQSDELANKNAEIARQSDELAKLKKNLSAAQDNVAALQKEKANQTEMKTRLVQKVKESTSRILALQSQYVALENELRRSIQRPAADRSPAQVDR